ncbi:pyruvate phosphate dikinase [Thermodesulfobium acidiphilum]|uniref:Pyruvate, phosphate dikinase n=1 Tax=Thermodesulfobium acidiphilum TaxID=1794699 RepID=A0A2R4W1Y6_THEAF|nr:pyruvate, phosphate dikinase [Thermodesulfobium acidiphilum]AWB10809.1 pyruvate phosphate dikinase [Thermodesulfobium acidiphilum]
MGKWVYLFEEGNASMRDLLGGKGAGLAEMTNIGLPVPPGFTITTEVCNLYMKKGEKVIEELWPMVLENVRIVEEKTGKKFAAKSGLPLLFSVRSGAKFSMPGMMDTVLNIGLNDETVELFSKESSNPRLAYDSYRRLIQMFGDIVLDMGLQPFENELESLKAKKGIKYDVELSADDLKELIKRYFDIYKKFNKEFPQDPFIQLRMAIEAVFRSWNAPRAITYRRINNIPDDLGTAVNVVTMVFGNMGDDSATGVAFTRDPKKGDKGIFGEYLVNAQGEDVVAGIRTPKPIIELKKEMPAVYDELLKFCKILEEHYKDMQDIEFTIEKGKLYMLQVRTGKRTPGAAVKLAMDFLNEGLISEEEAILRVEPSQVDFLLHPRINVSSKLQSIAKGLGASPGAATGKVVFDADLAAKMSDEDVILVRPETVPDDIHGLAAAKGVLTARGGMTSHAAVVARGMGKPAVVGAESIKIDLKERLFTVNGETVKEFDVITIDGTSGNIFKGVAPLIMPELSEDLKNLLSLSDKLANIQVRANADTPEDAKRSYEFGAKGIGLCRTEHMFMAQDRLPAMQEMIVAETIEERKAALEKLLPMQREDFYGIFKEMKGYPVIIRLLDPPLHEFLPKREILKEEISQHEKNGEKDIAEKKKRLLRRAEALKESNPMMGFRGCRLGLVYPEINEMQVRAILEAAAKVMKEGDRVFPEIMVPLVGHINEIRFVREKLEEVAKEVILEQGIQIPYLFGTMIELPRAALRADEIAKYAKFFSFGTNDLTQMTFGFSRDDAESKFLPVYLERGILPVNPFQTLDRDGVGELMKIAVERGKKVNKDLEIGICGEHGGDPESIAFCYEIGLNYVSCSPFRVPVARLAAARATILAKRQYEADK